MSEPRIARVFPRRTKATPVDELAFIGPPGLFVPEVDEVHISVTFTWDIPLAERLAESWAEIAPVKMGGPAFGHPGGEFVPGLYLKPGYVITSRGCPNNCWFCLVPRREGPLRELPITEGCNVLDDNLLACSDGHIRAVFAMLWSQNLGRVEFTGGLEAARLQPWQVDEIVGLHPKQIFFAYDTPEDFEALVQAARMFLAAGIKPRSKCLRAYVLIGYPGDSLAKAEKRLRDVLSFGVLPMAMLYRDATGRRDPAWMKFQRPWVRAAIMRIPAIAGGAAGL